MAARWARLGTRAPSDPDRRSGSPGWPAVDVLVTVGAGDAAVRDERMHELEQEPPDGRLRRRLPGADDDVQRGRRRALRLSRRHLAAGHPRSQGGADPWRRTATGPRSTRASSCSATRTRAGASRPAPEGGARLSTARTWWCASSRRTSRASARSCREQAGADAAARSGWPRRSSAAGPTARRSRCRLDPPGRTSDRESLRTISATPSTPRASPVRVGAHIRRTEPARLARSRVALQQPAPDHPPRHAAPRTATRAAGAHVRVLPGEHRAAGSEFVQSQWCVDGNAFGLGSDTRLHGGWPEGQDDDPGSAAPVPADEELRDHARWRVPVRRRGSPGCATSPTAGGKTHARSSWAHRLARANRCARPRRPRRGRGCS